LTWAIGVSAVSAQAISGNDLDVCGLCETGHAVPSLPKKLEANLHRGDGDAGGRSDAVGDRPR